MALVKDTQQDLFASDGELPDWLHVDWTCQNRQPGRTIDDRTLPSVQCSLPPVLRLSTFCFNMNMLTTEDGIKTIFRCLRVLYQQIVSSASETAIVDLDRSLSYITAFAQNVELNGEEETLCRIAREIKFFIVQAGSLGHYITGDDSFATRNIETNYVFHALLIVWLKALHIANFLKRFGGFEKLYLMWDASSSAEQISVIVAYGLLLSASRAGRPSVCRCIISAWHQLYLLNNEMFWTNMEKVLALCTSDVRYLLPNNLSSDMFLDLYDANGSVSAEIFLELICELNSTHENVFILSGKALSNYVECLRRIAMKVVDRKCALKKLYFLFNKSPCDSLLGAESILQYFFTHLCTSIMESHDIELDFYPANGKVWKEYLQSCCDGGEGDDQSEWVLFIRLMSLLTKKSESVWRSMKSRVFSKFPTKRYREMPIYSLINIFSLFITTLFGRDVEETSNKIIALVTTVFDPSDRERHDILIRAVQCVKFILEESHYDFSLATSTLISLMGRLDDKKDVLLYTECCICIGEKMIEAGSLARFLPLMNDMDLEQFFSMTAKCRSGNNVLWNAAVNRLKSPIFSAAVGYIVEQLAIRIERNATVARQNIRFVMQNLLGENNCNSEIPSYFLREFLRKNGHLSYPAEQIVPLWLAVVLEERETNELTDISVDICKKIAATFRKNGLYLEAFPTGSASIISMIRWLFETLSKNAMKNKKWVCENMTLWCELLVPPLQNTLMKAEEATAMRCCRVASYLYLYVAQLIYKPPSECNFNRSPFVRLCKLLLQNVLLVREFPVTYVREVLPNYLVGLLSLPVHSVPYLLRVVSDLLEKYSTDYMLKEAFMRILEEKPQAVSALYSSSKVGSNLFNFVSQIK